MPISIRAVQAASAESSDQHSRWPCGLVPGLSNQVIGHKEGVKAELFAARATALRSRQPNAPTPMPPAIAETKQPISHRGHDPTPPGSVPRPPEPSTAAAAQGSRRPGDVRPRPGKRSNASAMTSTSPWISVARGPTGPFFSG